MKTAFIFSGQGAQYIGMGKELYENYDVCKEVFNKANEALGIDIKRICFEENEDLNKTEFTQPAILTMSIAALKVLEQKGIKADYLAGLSLGEYSALVASSCFEFSETVALVRKRGKFMTEAVPAGEGAMSAVLNLGEDKIKEACDEVKDIGRVMIANYNAPGQIVVAGDFKAVEACEPKLLEKGAKRAVRLNVSGPFHTTLLKPASDKLNQELKNISINDLKIPVVTNLTGDIINSSADVIDILTKQVMSSVRWEQSINKLIELGVDTFIEVGPGKTLSSFVKKISKEVKIYNVEDLASLEKTCKGLGVE